MKCSIFAILLASLLMFSCASQTSAPTGGGHDSSLSYDGYADDPETHMHLEKIIEELHKTQNLIKEQNNLLRQVLLRKASLNVDHLEHIISVLENTQLASHEAGESVEIASSARMTDDDTTGLLDRSKEEEFLKGVLQIASSDVGTASEKAQAVCELYGSLL